MKKKLGFLVIIFLMLLTSCDSNKNVYNDSNAKNDISKEMFVKAYDEYCIDFDDLTYDDFYNKSYVSRFNFAEDLIYHLISITDSIKYYSFVLKNGDIDYKSIEKYNETGKTILEDSKEYENGIWYDHNYITYNYNESGNLVSKNEKAYFSKTNKIKRETTYEYINDEAFKNNTTIIYLKNDTTIIYDENGNQIQKNYIEYDPYGETLRIEYKKENGEFVKYKEIQCEYDSNYQIKSKSIFELIDDKWIQTYKYNNYLVIFSIETSVDGLEHKKEYEYDDNGHLLKYVESKFSEDNWIFDEKREYDGIYYTDGSFLGTRIDYKFAENNWVNYKKYVWESNEFYSYEWKNNNWVLIA